MSPTNRLVLRLAVVVVSACVLQVGVFSQVPIAGTRALVPLLVAVAAGWALGPERGAVVGFAAGLGLDLVIATPVGLCAAVFTVAGHLVGRAGRQGRRRPWWQAPLTLGSASAATYVALLVVGWVLGQAGMRPDHLVSAVVVVGLVHAALAPLAVAALGWAGSRGDRITMMGAPRVG